MASSGGCARGGELEEFLGQLSPMMSELFIESVCDVPDRVSCDNPRINLL
jgi:hypothetical protein